MSPLDICRFISIFSYINNPSMLTQQKRLVLSDYQDLYALVVPANHLLRKINELIDFSFVYKELRH